MSKMAGYKMCGLSRMVNKSMLKKLWDAISKQNISYVLLWNLPLGITLVAYWMGLTKLIFLQMFNFKIAFWNKDTELAIKYTLWIYHHPWVILLYALVLNSAFLFLPRTKSIRYLRWLILLLLIIPALWYTRLGLYLFGKIIAL